MDNIEIFLALVRTLNLTKTAELLHLSQSTVSRRLTILENSIGIKLFERKRGQKKIRLTPKGHEFISIAQRWSTLWQEIHSLKASDPQISLAIGSVDSLNTTLLYSLYQKLINHTPKCKLKILTKTSPEIYELVEKREIDIGFVLREINSSNIISDPVFHEPMVVISLSEKKNQGAKIHPSDLDPRYEIFFNWSPTYMIWHNHWWDPHISCKLEVDTTSLIVENLRDNPNYWAIVPKSTVRSVSPGGDFHMFELTDAPPNRVCYKIVHRYPYSNILQKIELVDSYLKVVLRDLAPGH